MLSIAENITGDVDLTYPSCIIPFLLISFGMYIFFVRWMLAAFVIKRPKLTRKESNKRIDDRIDAIFGRKYQELLRTFSRWVLCFGYTEERKGKFFRAFVIFNYIYLIVTAVCIFFWILAFPIPSLEIWCLAIMKIKVGVLDMPVILLLTILFFTGRFSKIK